MTRVMADRPLVRNMVWIAGGTFRMGSDRHYREEAPSRTVTVEGFWIDRYPVTNAQFGQFVKDRRYFTVAERALDPADYPGADPKLLRPGGVVFKKPTQRVDLRAGPVWWHYVPGASWRRPTGPGSTLEGKGSHPVVQVAYEDAAAYAEWAGKELPTEAEWEFAARGGLEGREFAWGDEVAPGGRVMANVWQGIFPRLNLREDGFERTSPVGCFPANGYGLYDMIGNVWEWTADGWSERNGGNGVCCAHLPDEDLMREASRDPSQPFLHIPRRVLKGGSYLCAPNYCMRYRPAARIPQQVDTGTCHQGFRCVIRPVKGQR
jgi:formylglycine-generating enzyme required for sulfatase activity